MKKTIATPEGGIDVEMTASEEQARQSDIAESAREMADERAEKETKNNLKRSGLQRLRAAGLTKDEIEAIFGMNLE